MSPLPSDPNRPPALAAWHAIAENHDADGLDALLSDEVVFRSPAIHTPQQGRALTTMYLRAALIVLGPSLTYLAEWYDDHSAVLEFEAVIGEEDQQRTIHGVDMLRWDGEDRLTSFTVMARPYKGLEALMGAMMRQLTP
ncbi:nuclear transport factor 2 family protein [Nocardioides salsibiostraticola]